MNREKFKQLVLYIADRSSDDPAFGAVKLNKLLYYCDFRAFAWLGSSITETSYVRRSFGPVPVHISSVKGELIHRMDAIIWPTKYHKYDQERLVPQVSPNLTVFSPEELGVVESVLSDFAGLNATEMSLRSHQELGWQAAGDGEIIPYETVFLSDDPLTPEEIRRGQELAREHEWLA